MKIVWPSAARAHDLFGGAKGDCVPNKPEFSISNNPSMERNKRSAEQALGDNSFTNNERPAIDSSQFDYIPSMRQSDQHHQQRPSYDSGDADMFTTDPSANSAYLAAATSSSPSTVVASTTGHHTMNTNSSYSWQGPDNLNYHHFNTPLSTAVLPHIFSTGLVGSGLHAPQARHGVAHPQPEHAHRPQHLPQHAHSPSSRANDDRYQPPFFDQASYPHLLSPAYDMPGPVNVAQQPSMYLPEQYSLYSGSCFVHFRQLYNNSLFILQITKIITDEGSKSLYRIGLHTLPFSYRTHLVAGIFALGLCSMINSVHSTPLHSCPSSSLF